MRVCLETWLQLLGRQGASFDVPAYPIFGLVPIDKENFLSIDIGEIVVMYTIESNTVSTALETVASAVINDTLNRLKFPFKRVKFSVVFEYAMGDFASHKIDVKKQTRGVKGNVVLRVNGFFLNLNPGKYLSNCIAHEIAHIMYETECVAGDHDPEAKHGVDWQRWLNKVDPEASIQTHYNDSFDKRAVALYKGGFCCKCDCGGLAGFHALANTNVNINRVKEKTNPCQICGVAIEPIQKGEIPKTLLDQMEFISKMQHMQSMHS